MSQLQTKWIADDAVNDNKVKLRNNHNLRARNAAGNADVNLLKLNASDQIELASDPYVGVNKVQTAADKGVANGIVPLDGSSKIAATYLPSYVDDVLEFANLAAFPVTGEAGVIYVAIDTGKVYRWSGSIYVEISTSEVTSVNTQTGAVVLDASHLTYTQADVADWTVADGSSIKATLDEAGDRLATLEGAPAAKVSAMQVITLTGTDITNQFVTLANTPVANSVSVFPKGGLQQTPGDDFTVAGAVVTFAGALAAHLASGDKLVVEYMY
jgi:hypothetical protein